MNKTNPYALNQSNEASQSSSHPSSQSSPQSSSHLSGHSSQSANGIRVDGFGQILEMLRVADPAFRESLLKRIAARDSSLANSLRRDLYKD